MSLNNKFFRAKKMQTQIKDFSTIKVSTKTIIAVSNLNFNLNNLYSYIPISNYNVIPKKRGRKCKTIEEDTNSDLQPGSIICVKDKKNYRGVLIKNKGKKSKNSYFLNSLTVVVVINDKKIVNIKISKNGKFQITGCKKESHYMEGVVYVMRAIQESQVITGEKIYELKEGYGNHPKIIFNVVMNNIDFKLGFPIQREKFDTFINMNTDFVSQFEASVNTGVNIKIKNENIYDDELDQITFLDYKQEETTKVESKEFLKYLDDKQLKKEMKKEKYHTFLVFSTSAVIYSGSGKDMKDIYKKFFETVLENRSKFEESSTIS